MSERLIPKEILTGCQRWELAPFERGTGRWHSPVNLPTAADLEDLHQRAHQEGFAQGYREGRSRAESEAQRLAALIESLASETHRCDRQVAGELVRLAADIARKMVGGVLRLRPDAIVGLVQEALAQYPVFSAEKRIALHPEDAAVVRAEIGETLTGAGWSLIEDRAVTRGGCRIETPQGELDATIAARWQRVMETLGLDAVWQDDHDA